jgi:hypothetical protein
MAPKARNTPSADAPRPLLHLRQADWPEADRAAFANAFDRVCDVFDENSSGSRLKPRTKAALWFAYRRWLGWINQHCPDLMEVSPVHRVTPETIKAFVVHLRISCSPRTVATQVGKLYDALRHMCPAHDWGWLKLLKTRLERATPKPGRRPIVITSQRLVDAGLARLDDVEIAFATARPSASGKYLQALALAYRDGLLVAIAALVPMRRTNIAQLEIGTTIRLRREHWSIHIPGDQVKNEETFDADLPDWIDARIERYLAAIVRSSVAATATEGSGRQRKVCLPRLTLYTTHLRGRRRPLLVPT